MSTKITRFGHHTPNTGVITVATEVIGDKLFIGTCFWKPNGEQYSKRYCNAYALHELSQEKLTNSYFNFDDELTYPNTLRAVLDILYDTIPLAKWAEKLISAAYRQPIGLKRYPAVGLSNGIESITVETEEDKEQLLLALRYLHDLRELDTDYVAFDDLVHMYLSPDLIKVAKHAASEYIIHVDDLNRDDPLIFFKESNDHYVCVSCNQDAIDWELGEIVQPDTLGKNSFVPATKEHLKYVA
jgi:hypothetical protein